MIDARTLSNGTYNGRPCKHCGGVVRFNSNGSCADKECRKARTPLRATSEDTKAKASQFAKDRENRRKEAISLLRENLENPVCRRAFVLLSPRESDMLGIKP